MTHAASTFDTHHRAGTLNRRLWQLCFALGLFILTAIVGNRFLPADRAFDPGLLGHDFIAFYSAGVIVSGPTPTDLYDVAVIGPLQDRIFAEAGFPANTGIAPWWNPPHAALWFVPLTVLPFGIALWMWWGISVACVVASGVMLARIVRSESRWPRHWLLAPASLLVAPAFVQSLGHGQNTSLSLLLMTAVVCAWRGRRAVWTGVLCALLCYKPQLAAIVAAAAVATLGRRVILGLLIGGLPQLFASLVLLPGTLGEWLRRAPENLRHYQVDQPYLWHRHATLTGFWRTLFQGSGGGATHAWVLAIAIASGLVVAGVLFVLWRSQRARISTDAATLDGFIVAVIIATPLLMPYFYDYDLLMLNVAAVLIGTDVLRQGDRSLATRALIVVGAATFVWTMLNPPLAERYPVNVTVPLLCVLFALHARRCFVGAASDARIEREARDFTTVRVAA